MLTEIPSRVRARRPPCSCRRCIASYFFRTPPYTAWISSPNFSSNSAVEIPLCHSKAEKHTFSMASCRKGLPHPHGIFPVLRTLSDTKIDLPCSSTGGFRITMPRKARTPDNPFFPVADIVAACEARLLHNWKSHTGKKPYSARISAVLAYISRSVSSSGRSSFCSANGVPGSTIRL